MSLVEILRDFLSKQMTLNMWHKERYRIVTENPYNKKKGSSQILVQSTNLYLKSLYFAVVNKGTLKF